MIGKRFFFAYIVFVFGFCGLVFVQQTARGSRDEKEFKDGRKLFLNVNIALSKGRFADAHKMAERLIRDYASDYQIREYLSLYEYTFALIEEEYRTGGIPPVDSPPPRWLKKKVQAMMARPDKSVLDLVKLVAVGDKRICGKDFPVNYLKEIVSRFSESPWADWAEWLLIENREYRPREKYRDKSYKERRKLLARDMYDARNKFIQEHPDSHMVPGLLHVIAGDRLLISDDEPAKQEAIRLSRRILEQYSTADSLCASARFRLRKLLGQDYQEQTGYSEEQNRIITRFYSRKFYLPEYKRSVVQYLSMKKDLEGELKRGSAKPGLPVLAYVFIPSAVVVVIVGLILLIKKTAGSRGK